MLAVTLYRADGACSLAPHALLTYLAVPFTSVLMKSGPDGRKGADGYQAADGSLTHASYLLVHPSGYVPALVVDGEAITEMPALLSYIVSLAPPEAAAGSLLGADDLGRARVAEWLAWLSGSVQGQGFAMLWRPARFTDDEGARDSISAKGRAVIDICFRRIEERLRGREFAVGQALTVVDFNLYVFWSWASRIGIRMAELYPSYAKLMRHVESIEAIRTVVKVEGLNLTASL